MKKGIAKFTAFCLAAGLTFGEGGMVLLAAAPDHALVGLSSTVKKNETKKTVTVSENALVGLGAAKAAPVQEAAPAEETAPIEEAPAEEIPADENLFVDHSMEEGAEGLDTSMVGSTGFAQCEEYLNVRSEASADSEALGKIYNNGSLEILGREANGWYRVRSGNVEGYVSSDYVAIGEEASSIAAATGYTTASSGVEALNVRSDASSDAEIMSTIDGSHTMEVVEDQGDWVKVLVDGEMYGYVSADYVSTTTEYATGETVEEEQARLEQEWLDYLAEQEAQQAAAEAAYLAAIAAQQSQATYTYTDTSYTDAAAQQAAQAAAQAQATAQAASSNVYDLQVQVQDTYAAYVTAQDAADTAVANGADEATVTATCEAAQSAYASYVSLQTQLDTATIEAANAEASAQQAAEAQAAAETQAAEAQAAAQAEAPQETAAYTEAPAETPAPSYSSAGQSIADFACQFVGNPYVWGGSSLTGGADCSGFTMAVMANFGIGLPHNAAAQSGCGTPVSLDALQPGDLLFYNGGSGIGHVSIYIGNGQVVHASNPSSGIKISSYGYRTPCAARRFV